MGTLKLNKKEKGCFGFLILIIILGFIGVQMPSGLREAPTSMAIQQSRTIALMLFAYSNDHGGEYPQGKSSTEVFQQLLDGNYCSDPAIFYLPLPGKTQPIAGKKLNPENVCYDVTKGVDENAPDGLPVIFITGYKVTYAPSGAALPLMKIAFLSSKFHPRTWLGWWQNEPRDTYVPGIAVCYKDLSAKFISLKTAVDANGTVPNFIPADFDAKGKTYRQLTPDGELPP